MELLSHWCIYMRFGCSIVFRCRWYTTYVATADFFESMSTTIKETHASHLTSPVNIGKDVVFIMGQALQVVVQVMLYHLEANHVNSDLHCKSSLLDYRTSFNQMNLCGHIKILKKSLGTIILNSCRSLVGGQRSLTGLGWGIPNRIWIRIGRSCRLCFHQSTAWVFRRDPLPAVSVGFCMGTTLSLYALPRASA